MCGVLRRRSARSAWPGMGVESVDDNTDQVNLDLLYTFCGFFHPLSLVTPNVETLRTLYPQGLLSMWGGRQEAMASSHRVGKGQIGSSHRESEKAAAAAAVVVIVDACLGLLSVAPVGTYCCCCCFGWERSAVCSSGDLCYQST